MGKDLRPLLITVALVVAVVLIGTLVPDIGALGATPRWGLMALSMVAFLAGIGFQVNGRAAGALIDGRFKISLSRLQLAAWTILTLSAFLAVALPRSLPSGLSGTLTDDQVGECIARLEEGDTERAAKLSMLWEGPVEVEVETEATDEDKKAAQEEAKAGARAEAREKALEACPPDPLGIRLPPELLLAMGISVGSFVSASLVKSTKASKTVSLELTAQQNQEVEEDKLEATAAFNAAKDSLDTVVNELAEKKAKLEQLKAALAAAPPENEEERKKLQEQIDQADIEITFLEEQRTQLLSDKETARKAQADAIAAWEAFKEAQQEKEGLLHRNSNASEAAWSDIFRGEEIGNYGLIDLGKVQMFFLTITVVFSYAAAVYTLLANGALNNPLGVDFPAFSDTMNVLLGISHAGYLTNKAVDQTQTKS